MEIMIYKAGKLISNNIYGLLNACNKSSILETRKLFGCHSTDGIKYARKLASDTVELNKIAKLDFEAPAARYFAVDSLENLNTLEATVNHVRLNEMMAKSHCYSGRSTDIPHFKQVFFDMPYDKSCWETAKVMCTPHFPIGYCGIKMSFTGFKFNGKNAIHSIGFIGDGKGQLFILDSLGNTTPEMQAFHKQISDIILEHEKGVPNGIRKVVFNTKVQQSADELTCNNWTMANLKAVQEALNKGEQIVTAGAIDRILPNDINKILEEQMELAKKSNYSISL